MTETTSKLYDTLQALDDPSRKLAEYEVESLLRPLHVELEESGESIPEALTWELMAFGFCEDYNNKNGGWGLYYGPQFVLPDKTGQWVEGPSIQRVNQAVIDYWTQRYQTAKHPLLRCRYADLCWDMAKRVTGVKPSIDSARTVIDSVVALVDASLFQHENDGVTKLRRAQSLALKIGDTARCEAVRDRVLAYEDMFGKDHHPGLWGMSYDLILDNPKVPTTEAITAKIVAGLEARLLRLTAASESLTNEPFGVEYAATRLAQYYRKLGRSEDVRRVMLSYGNFMVSISVQSAAIVAIQWLTTVYTNYMHFGLSPEADVVAYKISELGTKIDSEMVTKTHELSIPKDKWDAIIKEYTEQDLEGCLLRLAHGFVPDRNQTEQQVRKMAKDAPFYAMVPIQQFDESGRPMATIGSVEEDLDGRIVHHMSQYMAMAQVVLSGVLDAIREKYQPTPEYLLNYLEKSPLFDEQSRPLLDAGLKAYFNNDMTSAIHILIPRIEAVVRNIPRLLGVSDMKKHRSGGFVLKNLDDMLRDDVVRRCLGEKYADYLSILLCDQRGWNLRNNVCHGIQAASTFNRVVADRIIHALLVLGMVRKNESEQ
jgi:hypothetical protein